MKVVNNILYIFSYYHIIDFFSFGNFLLIILILELLNDFPYFITFIKLNLIALLSSQFVKRNFCSIHFCKPYLATITLINLFFENLNLGNPGSSIFKQVKPLFHKNDQRFHFSGGLKKQRGALVKKQTVELRTFGKRVVNFRLY